MSSQITKKCPRCNRETSLYVLGNPVCVFCGKAFSALKKEPSK